MVAESNKSIIGAVIMDYQKLKNSAVTYQKALTNTTMPVDRQIIDNIEKEIVYYDRVLALLTEIYNLDGETK